MVFIFILQKVALIYLEILAHPDYARLYAPSALK
jgi:hypothetical protein